MKCTLEPMLQKRMHSNLSLDASNKKLNCFTRKQQMEYSALPEAQAMAFTSKIVFMRKCIDRMLFSLALSLFVSASTEGTSRLEASIRIYLKVL